MPELSDIDRQILATLQGDSPSASDLTPKRPRSSASARLNC